MMYAEELRDRAEAYAYPYQDLQDIWTHAQAGPDGSRYSITCRLGGPINSKGSYWEVRDDPNRLLIDFKDWLAAHATPKPEAKELPF